jgi:tyrosyl-tRNA synthetase
MAGLGVDGGAPAAAAAEAEAPHPSGMTLEERYTLARSVGEECTKEEELRALLAKKPAPVCYDGFEPSGRMHIAQGVMKALNVNKLTKTGCVFKFWVADWFAYLNNKMGGDLKKIRKVGEYMIEVWKAIGMDMERVEFIWTSDEINSRAAEYWPLVMDIARVNNLKRIIRCSQIMGRSETSEDGEGGVNLNLSAAQIMYPCMQCADIFFLKADICQLGVDQRKVNMLAREYCDLCKPKRKFKPVILSHHMLGGLQQGQEKMSKSDPNSAIFMEDSEIDVKSKIKKAYCPAGEVKGNPVVEYVQYVILPWSGEFTVERKEENGGNKTYTEYSEFEADFISGALHPADVKPSLSKALNTILQPVRDHFKNNKEAAALLKQVRSYKTTR